MEKKPQKQNRNDYVNEKSNSIHRVTSLLDSRVLNLEAATEPHPPAAETRLARLAVTVRRSELGGHHLTQPVLNPHGVFSSEKPQWGPHRNR